MSPFATAALREELNALTTRVTELENTVAILEVELAELQPDDDVDGWLTPEVPE